MALQCTGRAANRLSAMTGVQASTIHRLLRAMREEDEDEDEEGFGQGDGEEEELAWRFSTNKNNPLYADAGGHGGFEEFEARDWMRSRPREASTLQTSKS